MDTKTLQAKFNALAHVLTERSRRVWAATEARSLGHGGIALVEQATGISRSTIQRGVRELEAGSTLDPTRARRPGGGRKRAEEKDVRLLVDLESLVDPTSSGGPDSPLRWTTKSLRRLEEELALMGHSVSHRVVGQILIGLDYSLQANKKTLEGSSHPDRDVQFCYINDMVKQFQSEGHPAISVDTKKKELVGDFKNAGRVYRPKGNPEPVRVHDFLIPENGKAIPYGVYDLQRNEGWVSIGIDHDTGHFAVHSIRRWWKLMGRAVYNSPGKLLIVADGGGSNGSRLRLWKWELQKFAKSSKFSVTVCRFPPGTSKWNKIEHRLFSHIAMNWKGKPLVDLATIVSLIGSTKSRSGLRVRTEFDYGTYPSGISVTDEQMSSINLERYKFHGDWNYTISPKQK